MQINNQDVLNDRFTNLYPVVKTIKFGLTAFPRTEAVIRDNDLCGMDEYISENMSRIRDIYRKCVARAVSEALGRADCVDWAGLRGAYESMRTEMCKAANAAERRKAIGRSRPHATRHGTPCGKERSLGRNPLLRR